MDNPTQLYCCMYVMTSQFVQFRAVSDNFHRAMGPGSQLGSWGLNDHSVEERGAHEL